jgi:hypothetical protein
MSEVLTRLPQRSHRDDEPEGVLACLAFALGQLAVEGVLEQPTSKHNSECSGFRGGTIDAPLGLDLFNKALTWSPRELTNSVAASYSPPDKRKSFGLLVRDPLRVDRMYCPHSDRADRVIILIRRPCQACILDMRATREAVRSRSPSGFDW